MDEKIIVDTSGLNLSEEEKEQLQAHLQASLVQFLQNSAKPASPITTLGPGWIGIEADEA